MRDSKKDSPAHKTSEMSEKGIPVKKAGHSSAKESGKSSRLKNRHRSKKKCREFDEILTSSSEIESELETIEDGKYNVLGSYSRNDRMLILQCELLNNIKVANEYRDSLQRMAADFDNHRKRSEKERQNYVKYANEGLILKLLEVVDNLDRALMNGNGNGNVSNQQNGNGSGASQNGEGSTNKTGKKPIPEDFKAKGKESNIETAYEDPFLKGIQLIKSQFLKLLTDEGITPIDEVNIPFDPYKHDAMMQVVNTDLDEDTVTDVFLKGYYLKDKVIRPAQVRVSKKE